MPRSWYFPRWRNLLMQSIMWVLLGVSVGLAALLDHHLRREQILDLSAPIVDGPMTFQFPASWPSTTVPPAGDGSIHRATDTQGSITRVLTISRQRVDRLMTPAEYVIQTTALPEANRTNFAPATLGGWPAQSIESISRLLRPNTVGQLKWTLCCATVIPPAQAIMVTLEKNADFDTADSRLFSQILDAIQISGAAPASEGSIQLSNQISVDVPGDFQVYPQPDPFDVGQTIVQVTGEGEWLSARLISAVAVGKPPVASVISGITAQERISPRDPERVVGWFNPVISHPEANHWQINPRSAPGTATQQLAHLVIGSDGRALLVILTASPALHANDLDQAWGELSGGVHFGGSSPVDAMFAAGSQLAKNATMPQWSQRWWLWSHGKVPIGFSQDGLDGAIPIRRTVRKGPDDMATAVVQRWNSTGGGGENQASAFRSDAEPELNNPFFPSFEEITNIGDQVVTTLHLHDTTLMVGTPPPAQGPLVLGLRAMNLLSRVDGSPVAFWTERFPSLEQELLVAPVMIVARKSGEAGGVTCVEAQVNGAGWISRWYFRGDGALDHADFAGDLHLRPSDEGEIAAVFSDDRRLTPQAN